MSRIGPVRLLASVILLLSVSAIARADKTAAELLPPSTLAYVEINHPKDLVPLILDHPLRKEIEQSSTFRQITAKPQFKKFRELVSQIEQRSGVEWPVALEQTGGDEMVFAFEPFTQGGVLLIKPSDMKTADAVRDALLSMVRDDAVSHGNPDPVEVKTYRGLKAYHIHDAIVANLGPWVMISNKKALAQRVANTFLDGGDSLAADEQFAAGSKMAMGDGPTPSAWAFVRIAPIRLFAHQSWLDPKYKSDDPKAEFLFGGLIPIAQNAPYATASLWLDHDGAKLSAAAPYDPAWVSADRKFFFAPPGDRTAKPLMPDGTLLSVTAYRDLSALWQAGPDLFTEAVATQMAQTDSGLSNVLGGKSFSGDILGAIKPQMQFVVARQDYPQGAPTPSMRLPAGALVLEVKPPQFEAVRKHFRVAFQTLVTFGNLDGAQKGRPLLEMQTEKRGKSSIEFATYSTDDQPKSDKSSHGKDNAYLNFSPSLVISDTHLILSSTRQLAEQLADLDASEQGDQSIPANTLIQLKPALAAELIKANREQLIAKNMLEKGHDRATAEKEIDLLQTLVSSFSDASVRLVAGKDTIRLSAELKASAAAR